MGRIISAANLPSLAEQNPKRKSRDLQELLVSRAACNEISFLTKAKSSCTFFKMKFFLSWQRSCQTYACSHPLSFCAGKTLIEALREREMRALCRLISEHFMVKKTSPATAQHVNRSFPQSLYVLGIPAPTLRKAMYGKANTIEDTNLKLMKRVIASQVFHSAEKKRLDTVMVQIEKNIYV